MPRIVSGGSGWKSVELPGSFASDQNLAFLSSFEELTAAEADKFVSSNGEVTKRKKKKKTNKKKGAKGENSLSSAGESQRGKKKQTKRKKKPKSATAAGEAKIGIESEVTEGLGEDEAEEKVTDVAIEKGIRKKRKREPTGKRAGKSTGKPETSPGIVDPHGIASSTSNSESPCKKRRLHDENEASVEASEGNDEEGNSECDLSNWNQFALPDEVMKALRYSGFVQPTEIQSVVLPSAVRDRLDILGAAETGSGKTLAYVIPMVTRLLEASEVCEEGEPRRLRALILAPTRELSVQIKQQVDAFLKYTKFKAMSIVGGLSQQKQERLLKYRPEVVVATPGRLWAVLQSVPADSHLRDWSKLLCVVVDEADRMVEKGHFEELQDVLDLIKREGNEKRQTMVFSATLTFVHPAPKRLGASQVPAVTRDEKIKRLVEITGLRKERKVFDITRAFGTAETLLEARMNCDTLADKDAKVVYLLSRFPGRTLIFLNSIDAARRLRGILDKLKCRPLMLHAKMVQKRRLSNLETFAADERSVLLATDVAARGLDISGVQHVIHYQVPKTAELYVHRSGRTARASQRGITVLMVDPQDVQYYRRICRNLNREKELPIFPVDSPELLSAVKQRVRCATELEAFEHRIKKISLRENWFEKTAREADLLLDERDNEKERASEEVEDLRSQMKAAEVRLRRLLVDDLAKFARPQIQLSRYVTPELVANYGRKGPEDAMSMLEESEQNEVRLKKSSRALVKTRHLHCNFNDKRKRKKLKRR